MPERGLCPACGRSLYLAGGVLPVHENLGGARCAGSPQSPGPGGDTDGDGSDA